MQNLNLTALAQSPCYHLTRLYADCRTGKRLWSSAGSTNCLANPLHKLWNKEEFRHRTIKWLHNVTDLPRYQELRDRLRENDCFEKNDASLNVPYYYSDYSDNVSLNNRWLTWFLKKNPYFFILGVAVSAKRCCIIQGYRIRKKTWKNITLVTWFFH